jgi:hypothetical protein
LRAAFSADHGKKEIRRRLRLARMASGLKNVDVNRHQLASAIDDYSLEGICLARDTVTSELALLLSNKKFARIAICSRYEIWVHSNTPTPEVTRRALFRPRTECQPDAASVEIGVPHGKQ